MSTQFQWLPRAALVVVVMSVWSLGVSGQECPELVGRWPYGPTYAVDVPSARSIFGGEIALFGKGAAFTVADVSNLESPQIIGELTLPGIIYAIAVTGQHAYVANGSSGLLVVDLSNPSHPVGIGKVEFLTEVGGIEYSGWAIDVTVSDGFAYVIDWLGYSLGLLRVVDVRSPDEPRLVDTGHIYVSMDAGVVSGRFLYLAGLGGLTVFDISNPLSLEKVAEVESTGWAIDLAIVGDHVYLPSYEGGLQVFDISRPHRPSEVGLLDIDWYPSRVTAKAGFAYVSDFGGLWVVDVSNPYAPSERGFLEQETWAYPGGQVKVSDQHVFFPGGDKGLGIIDVSIPAEPRVVGQVHAEAEIDEITAVGGRAYATTLGDELVVFDVSGLGTPTELSRTQIPDMASGGLAVAGNQVYVGTTEGFIVYEVSAAGTPVEVGVGRSDEAARSISVSDGFLYSTDPWNREGIEHGLRIHDVRDPSNPVEIGFAELPRPRYDVAVSGEYAYVANGDYGVRVFDVRAKENPIEVGRLRPNSARYVELSGEYAYVATDTDGLMIHRVSVPESPYLVGVAQCRSSYQNVDAAHGLALVANGWGGLQVIDVSRPSSPCEVGFDGSTAPSGVSINGTRAYVSNRDAGFSIFDLSRCAPDRRDHISPPSKD